MKNFSFEGYVYTSSEEFERLKNLTEHLVHTELWTARRLNFRTVDWWFRVNRTPERTNFQQVEKSSGAMWT